MNTSYPTVERLIATDSAVSLRPVQVAQLGRGWAVDVTAADLDTLAASLDAPRRLAAKRGYLGGTEANLELARMLEERPEDFGAAGQIVLGAEAVEIQPGPRLFADTLVVVGLECIDGLQRLRVIADVRGRLSPEHLRKAVIRLEIRCGVERERARKAYDTEDRCRNGSTAQDRLIRCPNILRLMQGDWEKGDFDPRRGVTAGPHGSRFSMDDVTSALACLAEGSRPAAANLAATPEGRQALWADRNSALYRGVFHGKMSPVGVMRAVEAWRTAHAALSTVPTKSRRGHGHLIEYAPELICWKACRWLPLRSLHSKSDFAWDRAIERDLPARTVKAAEALVAQYKSLHPEHGRTGSSYKSEAPKLDLWTELADSVM
ncbi:hypothetical protein [Streptomyces sp. SP17KL33]|uniref:hypothetical protein n=1 Tax=Streptomyces sp. SP17KL33 TaxID=3002534 RepID=UPI002E789087|nr:hypothetical protein [Streptomyces sp. SP17KL33]MEE1832483.1 hypothetical protein [Streptomyces sp. SP17KL33]